MGLLLLQGSAALNPRTLFANNEQGLWLDPSQMSTLYQDSNGVTPCTAAGDPVGLILDQSRGGLGNLGPELVTNGGFDSWSGDNPTGWTIEGTENATNYVTESSGRARVVSDGSTMGISQTILTVGKWYAWSADVISVTGTCKFVFGTADTLFTTPGRKSGIVNANGTKFQVRREFACDAVVDNISIREVPGNHAYQTTSASRPTLARIPSSGRRNLITYSEDLTNVAWTKTNVSAASATNPTYNGGSTPSAAFLQQNVTIAGGTASKTFTFRVVLSGIGKVRIKNTHGGVLDNFSSDITLSSTPTAYTLTVTNGASAGNGLQSFGINPATDNAVFDVTVAQLQAEQSASATNYQRVVSTHDVTESGVGDLWHLVFDGSDDSLSTNSVDMTGTAQMTVIAGVRKLSDAAVAMIAELTASLGGNNGSFAVFTPNTPAATTYSFGSKGTNAVIADTSSGFAAPLTNVLTLQADISSDSVTGRINAAQVATSSSDQGSGNYSNAAIYIGRRGGSSFPFNGHLYQLIIRGKTTPTGKLLEAERFVGRKTGVSF